MKHLSTQEYKMVAINAVFNFCSVMASVFLNVYLYSYTGSLVTMAIYTAIRIGMFPLFFTLAGKLAGKIRFSGTLTIGLAVLSFQLAEVLFLNARFAQQPWLIYTVAMLSGIGESFFWCSTNSLYQLVSTIQSRSSFMSLIGMTGNMTSIISPIVSAWIISSSLSDTAGYITIFRIVLVVYLFLIGIACTLNVDKQDQPFHVLHCLKLSTTNSIESLWKANSIGSIFFGINNSLSLMLSGLLVYNATGGSGSIYSRLLSLFAMITIVAYAISSKKMNRDNMPLFYRHSAFWLSSSTIVLALFPNLYGALYYGIVYALSSAFYSNSYNLIGMEAIAGYEQTENIIGRVIAREIYLSIGRCTGMGMIVLANQTLPPNVYLQVSVCVISAFSLLASAVTARGYEKNHRH